ncbi:MAG TPA: hypothetical protein VJS40_09710 [Aestuariivirgaceae bacterium]|nr:hypothetical protein [Aestuariivirgaceae bacterium]
MTRLLLAAALSLLLVPAAVAKTGDRTDDRVGFMRNSGKLDPHARYPSDVVYDFGTVNVRGGKKTPYVEKCYWTAEPGILFKNLRQVCTRYTLENTE